MDRVNRNHGEVDMGNVLKHPMNIERSIKDVIREFKGAAGLSCKDLARQMNVLGINRHTIEGHISNVGNMPNAMHIEAYAAFFGRVAFYQRWLAYQGIKVSAAEPEAMCMYRFLTVQAEFLHTWTEVVEDGRVDHRERATVVPMMRGLSATMDGYALHLERNVA